MGHIKNAVYIPSVPTTLPELAGRILAAVAAVTPSMLTNVWTAPVYTHATLTEHLKTVRVGDRLDYVT